MPIIATRRFTCEDHTPQPEGYNDWHAWARERAKTHRQVKCRQCGRWEIWLPKTDAVVINRRDRCEEQGIIRAYNRHWNMRKRRESNGRL